MNEKELTKTFMMISNWKNPLFFMVLKKIVSALKVEGENSDVKNRLKYYLV